jgi:hypothetical protein
MGQKYESPNIPTFQFSIIPFNSTLYSTLSSFFKQENRSLKGAFGEKE